MAAQNTLCAACTWIAACMYTVAHVVRCMYLHFGHEVVCSMYLHYSHDVMSCMCRHCGHTMVCCMYLEHGHDVECNLYMGDFARGGGGGLSPPQKKSVHKQSIGWIFWRVAG